MTRYLAGLLGLCLTLAGCGGSSPETADADLSGVADGMGFETDVGIEDESGLDSVPGDVDVSDDTASDLQEKDADTEVENAECGAGVRPVFSVGVDEHCSSTGEDCWANAWASSWPPSEKATPTMVVGDCAFIRPPPLAWCDPACDPGTYCDEVSFVCLPYKGPMSAGNINVSGLSVACTIIPETQYYYYTPTFAPEPTDGDVFEQGSNIVVSAEGAEVPAFSVTAMGVANLDSNLTCPPALESGQSITVRWTKSGVGTVNLFIGSGNHASQFSRIECTSSVDRGEFVVDGSLITELLTDGAPIWRWTLTRAEAVCETVGDYDVALSITAGQACMW